MSHKTATGFKYISLLPRGFSFFDIKAVLFFFLLLSSLEKAKTSGNKIEILYITNVHNWNVSKGILKNNFI